ncbi:unnamed protein product [Polarella glacialis]|uniref:Uncharacterized protein n=1 Tax=Polarella glacialis TaxID=89957 RepID=A0A813HU65_POLGL|nr:unnamed protein product [Polarella glacialis]
MALRLIAVCLLLLPGALSASGFLSNETVTLTDSGCDLLEASLQSYIGSHCGASKKVTCVYGRYPDCSADDICNFKSGCGFVEDNDLVKFTSYGCSVDAILPPKGQVSCNVALTVAAVSYIVAGCLALITLSACCCYRCRRRRAAARESLV